jgi:hypothetical protein
MRKRDPRRLLRRHKEVKARVTLVKQPESAASKDGSVTTKQVADVTMPGSELERIWTTEYLERLARTYWHFLTKISLGILRVDYGPDSREVVAFRKPFVLLRFRAPQYETTECGGAVTWPINRGLLVAPQGRGKGFLRIEVEHIGRPTADGQVKIRVSSEVGNFYPLIAGWGWFSKVGRFVYQWTQLAIHVVVTNAFLRSLATLDLKESVIGRFRHAPERLPQMATATEPPTDEVAENVSSSSLLPHR